MRIMQDNRIVPIAADAGWVVARTLLEVAVAEATHQTLGCFREQWRRKLDCHRTSLGCVPWNHPAKAALLNAVNSGSRQAERDQVL